MASLGSLGVQRRPTRSSASQGGLCLSRFSWPRFEARASARSFSVGVVVCSVLVMVMGPRSTSVEAARHLASSMETRLSILRERMSTIQSAFDSYLSSVHKSIVLEKELKQMQGSRPPASEWSSTPQPHQPSIAGGTSFLRVHSPVSSPSLSRRALGMLPSSSVRSTPSSSASFASTASSSPVFGRKAAVGGAGGAAFPAPSSLREGFTEQQRQLIRTRMKLARENFEQDARRAAVRNLMRDQWSDLMIATTEGPASSPPVSRTALYLRRRSEGEGKDEDPLQLYRMADKLTSLNYHLELDQATRLDPDS